MGISIAPTTSYENMTLMATPEEWTRIVKKMITDKNYKDVGTMLKGYVAQGSTGTVQKITLPKPQAQQVLAFCGISW